jgi:pyruvate/2-oxoglutarate dehydrogenase complex dihydrolipoamide acyltransferase (E2) component
VLLALVGVVCVGGLFVFSRRGSESTPAPPAPSETSQPSSPSADTPQAAAEQNAPQQDGAAPSADKGEAGGRGLPSPVARALDAKKTVVILFWTRGGIDDRSVKTAVDRLPRNGGKTAVFTDKVANLSNYTRVTAAASVNQTPALVIVNPKGQAEVLNGYYDFQTIRQFVRNAARR